MQQRQHGFRHLFLTQTLMIAALLNGGKAFAAEATLADEPPPAVSRVEVGPRGIRFTSPDEQFQFDLRMVFQWDARFFLAGEGTDTFLVRNLRPILAGRLYENFSFFVMPELADDPHLIHGWVNYLHTPEFQIRVGRFSAPYGIEFLQPRTALRFIERGFPSNFVPSSDQGVQVHGVMPSGLGYKAAVLTGVEGSAIPRTDADGRKTFAGRLFWEPTKEGAFEGLGIGLGGSYGNYATSRGATAISTQRSPGRVEFFAFERDVRAAGNRWRLNPHLHYYRGPFGLVGEVMRQSQEVARAGRRRQVVSDAWLVSTSWVLTGEDSTFTGVVPHEPFSPGGGWGAWEIVARIHGLRIGDEVFAGDPGVDRLADPATQHRNALAYGAGVNWYLNQNFRIAVNLEQTSFSEGDADRDDELALFSRVQLSF